MVKKIIALMAVAVFMLSMTTAAFAATPVTNAQYGVGYARQCYNLMRDSNGNFVDKDTFEKNLDKAIEDGFIRSEDRGALIEMYDYCAANGFYMGGGCGMGGGGCGMGRRWAS